MIYYHILGVKKFCTGIIISKSIARGLNEGTTVNTYTSDIGGGIWEERGTLIPCSAYYCTICLLYNKNVFVYNLIYNI